MSGEWEQVLTEIGIDDDMYEEISRWALTTHQERIRGSRCFPSYFARPRDLDDTTAPNGTFEGERDHGLDKYEVYWLTEIWCQELVIELERHNSYYLCTPSFWSMATSPSFRFDQKIRIKTSPFDTHGMKTTFFDRYMVAIPVLIDRKTWMAAAIVNPKSMFRPVEYRRLGAEMLPVVVFADSDPNGKLVDDKARLFQRWLIAYAKRLYPDMMLYTKPRLARVSVPSHEKESDSGFHMLHNFRMIHDSATEILRRLKWESHGDIAVLDDLPKDVFEKFWRPDTIKYEKAALQGQLAIYWRIFLDHISAGTNDEQGEMDKVIDLD